MELMAVLVEPLAVVTLLSLPVLVTLWAVLGVLLAVGERRSRSRAAVDCDEDHPAPADPMGERGWILGAVTSGVVVAAFASPFALSALHTSFGVGLGEWGYLGVVFWLMLAIDLLAAVLTSRFITVVIAVLRTGAPVGRSTMLAFALPGAVFASTLVAGFFLGAYTSFLPA